MDIAFAASATSRGPRGASTGQRHDVLRRQLGERALKWVCISEGGGWGILRSALSFQVPAQGSLHVDVSCKLDHDVSLLMFTNRLHERGTASLTQLTDPIHDLGGIRRAADRADAQLAAELVTPHITCPPASTPQLWSWSRCPCTRRVICAQRDGGTAEPYLSYDGPHGKAAQNFCRNASTVNEGFLYLGPADSAPAVSDGVAPKARTRIGGAGNPTGTVLR